MSAIPLDLYRTQAGVAGLLFPALLALAAIPFVARSYDRHGRIGTWPALVWAGGLLYACGLVAFTLFPLPADPSVCLPGLTPRLDPLQSLREIQRPVGVTGRAALKELVTSGPFLQVALNVALFVPLGLLVRYRESRGLLAALLLGLVASAAIELTQATADWGVYACRYRQADTGDVLVNTAGAGLGWCVGALVTPLLPAARPADVPDLAPPGLLRRVAAVGIDLAVVVLAGGLAVVALRALELVAPVDVPGADTASLAETTIGTWGPAVVLLLLMPLVRADRGTPGRLTVNVVPVRDGEVASRGRVAVHQLVRFGPLFAVLGARSAGVEGVVAVLVLLAAAGLATALLDPRARSLAGLVAGTQTATFAGAGLRADGAARPAQ